MQGLIGGGVALIVLGLLSVGCLVGTLVLSPISGAIHAVLAALGIGLAGPLGDMKMLPALVYLILALTAIPAIGFAVIRKKYFGIAPLVVHVVTGVVVFYF